VLNPPRRRWQPGGQGPGGQEDGRAAGGSTVSNRKIRRFRRRRLRATAPAFRVKERPNQPSHPVPARHAQTLPNTTCSAGCFCWFSGVFSRPACCPNPDCYNHQGRLLRFPTTKAAPVMQKLLRYSPEQFHEKHKGDIDAVLAALQPTPETLVSWLTEKPTRYARRVPSTGRCCPQNALHPFPEVPGRCLHREGLSTLFGREQFSGFPPARKLLQ
jgi:hypothetical protein